MTSPLPKWIMHRYAILWDKFKTKEFSHQQACNKLKANKEVVSVLISDLKKAGWIEVELNPKDTRKRLYKLKSPDKALREMVR